MKQLHKLFPCDTMSHYAKAAINLRCAEKHHVPSEWERKRTRQMVGRLMRANGLPLEG